MARPPLSTSQRQALLNAFLTMDADAFTQTEFLKYDWEQFFYEGLITLDGLWHVAEVIAQIQAERISSTAAE